MEAFKKPDIEFKRKLAPGYYRTYGHIYWKPFVVHILGKTIIGKKHLTPTNLTDKETV